MPSRDRDYDDYDDEVDEDDDRADEPKDAAPRKGGLLDALQLIFCVMAGVGLFLSLQGPAKNPAHLVFRLGIAGVSFVGLLVITVIKMTRPRGS